MITALVLAAQPQAAGAASPRVLHPAKGHGQRVSTTGAEDCSLLTWCETQRVGTCPVLGQAKSSAAGCSAFLSLATLHCKATSTLYSEIILTAKATQTLYSEIILTAKATSILYSEIILTAHGAGPGKSRSPSTMPGKCHVPLHVLPAPSLSPTCPQRNFAGTRMSY